MFFKSKIYQLLLILVFILVPLISHAVPPYLSISVEENLSFDKESCLQAGKKVLNQSGFQIMQDKVNGTLFAASYQKKKYQYQNKALIKCLPTDGVIIVVVVADAIKNISQKADYLLETLKKNLHNISAQQQHITLVEQASIPPYIGISVEKRPFATINACLQVAENLLYQEGFEKVRPYQNKATLFAAYRDSKPYHYKVVIKCLPKTELVIVVTVADSMKSVRIKAEKLLQQIGQSANVKSFHPKIFIENHTKQVITVHQSKNIEDHQINEDNSQPEKNEQHWQQQPENLMSSSSEKSKKSNQPELTSEAWKHTITSQENCLIRAKSAVKKSGFSHYFEINEYSAKGINSDEYIGLIRCVTDEEFVFFWTKGKDIQKRQQLLKTLQTHF